MLLARGCHMESVYATLQRRVSTPGGQVLAVDRCRLLGRLLFSLV